VKHTSPTRIKEYKFACPLLGEQKTIAKILSDLDSKIELLQKTEQNPRSHSPGNIQTLVC